MANKTGIGKEIDDKFGLFEKTVRMIKKYGIGRVLSGFFVFVLFAATIVLFVNQKTIIANIMSSQKEQQEYTHSENMQFRVKEINPRIDGYLYKILVETGANRAFIIEMHNGVNNPTGLPFAYGEMTYEKVSNDSVEYVSDYFEKLNLSQFNIFSYLLKYRQYSGDIDQLKQIDQKMASRISLSGAEYISMYGIRGNDLEIGWLGISYTGNNRPSDAKKMNGIMLDMSQRISILLDISNNINK